MHVQLGQVVIFTELSETALKKKRQDFKIHFQKQSMIHIKSLQFNMMKRIHRYKKLILFIEI